MFPHVFKFIAVALSCALLSSALVPSKTRNQWLQQNGPVAKTLNDQYAVLTANSSCSVKGQIACIDDEFAVCVNDKYWTFPCPIGQSCSAIPNAWSNGTTTTCNSNQTITGLFSEAGVKEFKRSFTPSRRASNHTLFEAFMHAFLGA